MIFFRDLLFGKVFEGLLYKGYLPYETILPKSSTKT